MAAPRNPGPTTISPNTAGKVVSLRSNVALPTPRLIPRSDELDDLIKLQRYILSLRKTIDDLTAVSGSNIRNSSVIQRNITFGVGATVAIAHNLGRPFQGYGVVRSNGAITVFDTPFTDGRTTDKWVQLTGTNAASVICDLEIY